MLSEIIQDTEKPRHAVKSLNGTELESETGYQGCEEEVVGSWRPKVTK